MRNMTQKKQIELFQKIAKISQQELTTEQFGSTIKRLLDDHNVNEWWEKKTNSKSFNKSELEIINAVQNGWQFYSVDGAIWYWENNIQDGRGPWADYGKKGQNLRLVSKRMINKLIDCGQFPANYQFKS